MIIGRSFAWGHIPKAAGDMTARLFQIFPELIEDADDLDDNAKHARFAERAVEGKRLSLNIRRLPSWMLSLAIHRSTRGVHPDYKPLPMESPHTIANSMRADERLQTFTDSGRLRIDHWLRVENLADDLLRFVGEFIDVDKERETMVRSFVRVNRAEYDRDVSHWFTPEQISRMYQRNPLWEFIERREY